MPKRSRRVFDPAGRPERIGPDVSDTGPESAQGGGWLTPGVLGVGAASLCSDTSHEMVTSLLPTFLTSTLHAGPGPLAVIESVSDALTGVCKLAGGPLASDRKWRARLASGGYLGTALATAAVGLTVSVWQVAVLRAVAWVSRGLRSPARDMLLTSLTRRETYGRAFGVERAGDNAGAVLGPLAAASLIAVLGVRHVIWLSVVPGMLAGVAIVVAAREARRTISAPQARRTLRLNVGELRRAGMVRLLIPVALFELGNVATTLLILRATGLLEVAPLGATGRSAVAATTIAIILYAGHNAVAALASLAAGQLCDRFQPRLILALGAAAYVAGYALFAVGFTGWVPLGVAFAVSGMGIGFGERRSRP